MDVLFQNGLKKKGIGLKNFLTHDEQEVCAL